MANRFVVSMLMLHFGTPRDQQAREELAAALPADAEVTDDHIVFLGHPDLPEHWRPRSARPAVA